MLRLWSFEPSTLNVSPSYVTRNRGTDGEQLDPVWALGSLQYGEWDPMTGRVLTESTLVGGHPTRLGGTPV